MAPTATEERYSETCAPWRATVSSIPSASFVLPSGCAGAPAERACASCAKLCLRTSGPRASPPAYNHGSGAHHGDPRDGPCVIRTVQVSQWSSLWVVRMLEADALREGTGRDAAVLWTPLSSWFLVRRGDLLCWILNGEGSAPVALPQHQAESIDSRCTHHELEPSRIHDVLLPSRYMQALRAVSCARAFKRASVPLKASCRMHFLVLP